MRHYSWAVSVSIWYVMHPSAPADHRIESVCAGGFISICLYCGILAPSPLIPGDRTAAASIAPAVIEQLDSPHPRAFRTSRARLQGRLRVCDR